MLLTARQTIGPYVAGLPDIQQIEHFLDPGIQLGTSDATLSDAKRHIFENRHVRPKHEILENHAEISLRWRNIQHIGIIYPDTSG